MRKCILCGAKGQDFLRLPALGKYVEMCPSCYQEFDAAFGGPLDPSLKRLDEMAADTGPSILGHCCTPELRLWNQRQPA